MMACNDKLDGGQQCNNQPTKGSAKAGGGGSGDSNSNGSGNDGDTTAQRQCNGDGDGGVLLGQGRPRPVPRADILNKRACGQGVRGQGRDRLRSCRQDI